MRTLIIPLFTVGLLPLFYSAAAAQEASLPVAVGTFGQEVREFYDDSDGLPSNDVAAIAIGKGGIPYAGTANGVAAFQDGKWTPVKDMPAAPAEAMCARYLVSQGALWNTSGGRVAWLPAPLRESEAIRCIVSGDRGAYLGTENGLHNLSGLGAPLLEALDSLLRADKTVVDAATNIHGQMAVATNAGLFYSADLGKTWQELFPTDGARSWKAVDCRAVAFGQDGRLWFAATQGVGVLADGWTLYEGSDGLPYNDFTSMACGADGTVWFGTKIGAIRFDGDHWAYRQGLRWLPHDEVRDVAVADDGTAWLATPKGVGCIRFHPMTLAEKAEFYDDEIDKYNRRTEYGYVLEVRCAAPGDKSNVTPHDSDNDGLWTSMYGAAQCYAYGATKDAKAKERAKKAFEALKFLGDVTQGGSHPAPEGFVARTILPTSGPNPNEKDYTPEKDREKQKGDKYWKVIVPRWPTSEDGKWYWKTDTSSDELDGHYFFYALYYDLVADTDEEKARVREHVRKLTDHLVDHGFCLVDHDGKPTRWAVFSPKAMNHDPNWFMERGLNSLSMLSYLAVAEHMTGDAKYREAADTLINEHAYAQNLLVPKIHVGPGSGNQSDDEMAFMNYYNLIRYEKDPKLRAQYSFSLYRYWRMEEPEMCPLFNFIFAACSFDDQYSDAFGTYGPSSEDLGWLDDAVAELKRFPLDRFDWRHTNSHRIDLVKLGNINNLFDSGPGTHGRRVNGKVIPVDECFFNHWNCNRWQLDTGGSGASLADGAVFTLPYYMGLYHGFIKE